MIKYWKYDEFSGTIIGRVTNKEVVATKSIADLQELINTEFKDFTGGSGEVEELMGIASELGLKDQFAGFDLASGKDETVTKEINTSDLDNLMNDLKEDDRISTQSSLEFEQEEEKPLDKE